MTETYTKDDVMRALAMVEYPVYEATAEIEGDNDAFAFFNAGARLAADAILLGMDAGTVRSRKIVDTARIMVDSLARRAAKGDEAERRGLL